MRSFYVFDLGETLIDFGQEGRWHANMRDEVLPRMNEVIATHLLRISATTPLSQEEWPNIGYQTLVEKPARHTSFTKRIQEFLTELSLDNEPDLERDLLTVFQENLVSHMKIYPDTTHCLQALKVRGFTLGMWSNTPWQSPGDLFHRILQKFHIHSFFDHLFFSGDYEIQKPDTRAFEIVIRESGQKKENMVYIGNAEVDIITGAKFGVPTVWVNRNGRELSEDCPEPTYEISLLDELNSLGPII